MKIIKGNKTIESTTDELDKLISNFDHVQIDLGTGDGLYVYKQALKNPKNLYMGIDPSSKMLEINSVKAVRKKLKNVLFVLGSVEHLPFELIHKADSIVINLPWGSLLYSVAKPDEKVLKNILTLLKKSGTLEIIFGYTKDLEPSETQRLDLDDIDLNYIKNSVIPVYETLGLNNCSVEQLSNTEIRKIETSWAKKISTKNVRPFFNLTFVKL